MSRFHGVESGSGVSRRGAAVIQRRKRSSRICRTLGSRARASSMRGEIRAAI